MNFETTIFLERPDKERAIIKKYHFSIPDKEFEGVRERDWYVYGRTHKEHISAIGAEAKRVEESQTNTYTLPTLAEAKIRG